MARNIASDPYQNFKFQVSIPSVSGGPSVAEAGFVSVTLPEVTVEMVEYKTGKQKMKQKYPGLASVNDITLTKGLVKADSDFFKFVLATQSGEEYRSDITIQQEHRDGTKVVYTLINAFGIRCKLGTDLDASSSDVSVEELDVAFEELSVKNADGDEITISG